MPIGPDTDRQGSGRGSRDLHWEETTGAGDYGQGGGSEFRHMGEDFEYIVRHEPEAEGHGAENPWVASIFDDSGRYSPVSGRLPTRGDAQSMAAAYHANEWYPGSEKDTSNPNNPDYAHHRGNPEQLREDQARMQKLKGTPDNPDYVAEGTEGMWEGIGQVATGAINVATDPLVIAGTAGYYAGKKGLLDKIGRGRSKGRKGPPDDRRLPPDDDPLADDPRTKRPPPPLGREGHPSAPTKSGPLGRSRPRNRPPDPPPFDLS